MQSMPDIPMLPVLSWTVTPEILRCHGRMHYDDKHVRFVNSGRAALALALADSNICSGDEVLLPAYHCPSMVYPVHWLEASPVFYCIEADTRPNIADIKSKITARTRAILAAHLFGLTSDFQELRQLCDDNDIVLIEDCAHTICGLTECGLMGALGDYAISSPRKFFPVQDGGLLFSARRQLDRIDIGGLGRRHDLKMIFNTLEMSGSFGRLRPLGSIATWLGRRGLGAGVSDERESASRASTNASGGAASGWKSRIGQISPISRSVLGSVSLDEAVERRRRNFRTLLEGLTSISNGTAMPFNIDEEFVPYVLLIELQDPDRHHAALRKAGVPVWRWEHLLTSSCPQSNAYSRSLVQIPCHQGLTERELELLMVRIRGVLS